VPRSKRGKSPSPGPDAAFRAFSIAVDHMRHGEQVVALIDPQAGSTHPLGSRVWLSSALTIAELPRLMLPGCDQRCPGHSHDPSQFVVLADLALDPAEARPAGWWEGWNESLDQEYAAVPTWYAGAPALVGTSVDRRLRAGTGLRRVTVTDPHLVHHDVVAQETLFRIAGGPRAGEALIAATFGVTPLLPGLAGILLVPDHPPVRDPAIAVRLLVAGWAAVERGLPYEA
jgi:hypothetical protein